MCKVIDELVLSSPKANYRSLALDEEVPMKPFKVLLIGGMEYKPIHVYDAPRGIAVYDVGESLLGKEVEFVD